MGRNLLISIVLAATFLLSGCQTPGLSNDNLLKRQRALAGSDLLIVPDQRIGPIQYGMDMDQVQALLGQPDDTIDSLKDSFGQSDARTYYFDTMNLSLTFNPNDPAPTVTSISTYAWRWKKDIFVAVPLKVMFHTAEGIHIGSTTYDVQRAYGVPTIYGAAGNGGYLMVYGHDSGDFKDRKTTYTSDFPDRKITEVSVGSNP